jgi:hypothetical protein
MSDRGNLHIKGRVLAGPEDVRDELWVVDGHITYERPRHTAHDPVVIRGSSTRTATSASTATGPWTNPPARSRR